MKAYDDIEKEINEASQSIQEIVDRTAEKYIKPLDEYIKFVTDIITDRDNPPTAEELDDMVLRLPTFLYFMGEAQEALGIREDVAKSVRTNVYNQAYNHATGTIGDKKAFAELASQQEDVIAMCYSRAYKVLRSKVETAGELLSAIKKVISRRMSENNLERLDTGAQ